MVERVDAAYLMPYLERNQSRLSYHVLLNPFIGGAG